MIANALGIDSQPLMPFADRPLRLFYSEAVRGGMLMRLGAAGFGTEVPLAFQSALADALLAAAVVGDATGLPGPKDHGGDQPASPSGAIWLFPSRRIRAATASARTPTTRLVMLNFIRTQLYMLASDVMRRLQGAFSPAPHRCRRSNSETPSSRNDGNNIGR